MSRLRNFAHGVASGYVQMVANIAYTLVSIPVALHYLSKKEFATWALSMQVVGYLNLIEFGMVPSVARILADHKDDQESGRYGGILKAGFLVFTLQGLLAGAGAWILAPAISDLLHVDAALHADFVFLLRGSGVIVTYAFATKIFSAPFWGFQRYDVGNYGSTLGFGLQLASLWLALAWGWGVRSAIFSGAVVTVFGSLWYFGAGLRLRLYPRRKAWGTMRREVIYELLRFGRDVFLMALGAQLLSASQVIIISRTLGLEAAAIWAICSKSFFLAQQAVGRVYEFTAGAFTEMYVRGEFGRLRSRLGEVVTISGSLAVAVGATMAVANTSFLEIWTHGSTSWPIRVDILLALFLVVSCVSRCLTGMAGIFKQLKTIRYIYFLEGLTFAAFAFPSAKYLGYSGIVLSAIVAMSLWSGIFGVKTVLWLPGCSLSQVSTWFVPCLRVGALLIPSGVLLRWLVNNPSPTVRLLILGIVFGCFALAVLVMTGLPRTVQRELQSKCRWRWPRVSGSLS